MPRGHVVEHRLAFVFLQIMCGCGLLSTLIDSFADELVDESDTLNPHCQRIFERLARQSVSPKALRLVSFAQSVDFVPTATCPFYRVQEIPTPGEAPPLRQPAGQQRHGALVTCQKLGIHSDATQCGYADRVGGVQTPPRLRRVRYVCAGACVRFMLVTDSAASESPSIFGHLLFPGLVLSFYSELVSTSSCKCVDCWRGNFTEPVGHRPRLGLVFLCLMKF